MVGKVQNRLSSKLIPIVRACVIIKLINIFFLLMTAVTNKPLQKCYSFWTYKSLFSVSILLRTLNEQYPKDSTTRTTFSFLPRGLAFAIVQIYPCQSTDFALNIVVCNLFSSSVMIYLRNGYLRCDTRFYNWLYLYINFYVKNFIFLVLFAEIETKLYDMNQFPTLIKAQDSKLLF